MPFLDSLDIGNRACQLCGVDPISSPTEDSVRNQEISNAYDKLRRAELRRNVWGFAVRMVALRPLSLTALTLVPSAYDASKTYLTGEIVKDTNNLFWLSQQADNINNPPGGNNDAWDMYFGPKTADLWSSTATYFAGELVYVLTGTTPNGYQVYMSMTSANSDVPGAATAYVPTTQYKQDDAVSYSGSQWRSLIPVNQGNTPADGPLGYSASTTYSISQQVTGSDNYIYTSVGNGNIGHDPTTDGGTHWTNTAALNAWSRSPALIASSINWRPIVATLKNIIAIYPLGSGPSTQAGTRNVFRLPCGYLREAPQNPKGGSGAPLGGPSGVQFEDWNFDGDYIVSAQIEPIILRFVADVTKVTAMDDMFCEGLASRIATAVCVRLTQSEGKLASIASAYKLFMGEARQVNGIEQGAVYLADDEYITVRY